MTPSSARHYLTAMGAIFLAILTLSSSAAAARRAPTPKTQLLTIHMGGCRFRPPVEEILRRVHAKVPQRPPFKAWLPAGFAFGPLHGVGVAAESHPDFSGEELYFREDREALRRVLGGIGLHVDRKGDVAEAAQFVEGGIAMVSVSIQAIDPRRPNRHFPAARSWLGCGSL